MRNFSKFKVDMEAKTTKEGADKLAWMLGLSAIIAASSLPLTSIFFFISKIS